MPRPHETARIQVFGVCPVHGDACTARWFTCHLQHRAPFLAEYACTPRDPENPEGAPHPDCVREVEALHPGAVFVYLD